MSFIARMLDRSIVFSFDRTGFKRHAKAFNPSDLVGAFEHQHVVVTGGNSGIGFASCEALVRHGASVTIVGRNDARTLAAAARLSSLKLGSVAHHICDLSDLESVRSLANRLSEVDVLVHNAGDMVHELKYTDQNIEVITATHVVGPYVLTEALRAQKKLGNERGGRVIFVSSGGMYSEPLNVEALNTFTTKYDGIAHYAKTKRAQVVLASALNTQYKGDNIHVASMHPGWVDTPALSRAMPRFKKWTNPILRTAEQGADTIVWLALCPITKWGSGHRFFFDRTEAPIHLMKKTMLKGDPPEALFEFVAPFV